MLDASQIPIIVRTDEPGDFWSGKKESRSTETGKLGTITKTLPYALSRIMALLVIAIGLLVFKDIRFASKETPLQSPIDLDGARPSEIATRAAEAVKAYLMAATIEDKLRHVRRPVPVRPLMSDHYSRHPLMPVALRHLVVRSEYQDIARAHDLYVIAAETEDDEQHSMLLEEADGHYYVDWESHVAYNPMSREQLLNRKPTRPQSFRVYATLSKYYNFNFDDPRKHLALELGFPKDEGILYGYIAWDNPSLKRMIKHLVDGEQVPMILDIQVPENARENQVEVTGFQQYRWFVAGAS